MNVLIVLSLFISTQLFAATVTNLKCNPYSGANLELGEVVVSANDESIVLYFSNHELKLMGKISTQTESFNTYTLENVDPVSKWNDKVSITNKSYGTKGNQFYFLKTIEVSGTTLYITEFECPLE